MTGNYPIASQQQMQHLWDGSLYDDLAALHDGGARSASGSTRDDQRSGSVISGTNTPSSQVTPPLPGETQPSSPVGAVGPLACPPCAASLTANNLEAAGRHDFWAAETCAERYLSEHLRLHQLPTPWQDEVLRLCGVLYAGDQERADLRERHQRLCTAVQGLQRHTKQLLDDLEVCRGSLSVLTDAAEKSQVDWAEKVAQDKRRNLDAVAFCLALNNHLLGEQQTLQKAGPSARSSVAPALPVDPAWPPNDG